MPSTKKLLQAAAGSAGGDNLYVEDVFSTYLYTGTSAAGNVVTNGIDLAGEGGLVWLKSRGDAQSHGFFDTERGAGKLLQSNATAAELPYTDVSSFNSDGFTAGYYSGWFNSSSYDQCSWSFRKAEKFFDVQTYTGNGTAGRTVAHNLGSVPAVMIVKSTTNGAYGWRVYHQSLGNTDYLRLDETNAAAATAGMWNNTTPTDSEFTLGGASVTNGNGESFVAYLFASDAGGFGDDEDENIIKCGSFTTDASGAGLVGPDLGFEPQWVLLKNATSTASGDWWMFDAMRGFTASGGGTSYLRANSSGAEGTFGGDTLDITSNGFTMPSNAFASGQTFIYIAIRRPMKTPAAGTEVLDIVTRTATNPNLFATALSYVDVAFNRNLGAAQTQVTSRLTGGSYLHTASTAAEVSPASGQIEYDYNYKINPYWWGFSAEVDWLFKRATGFMDVVAYTGNGAVRTIPHNLGVAPEMMLFKIRNQVSNWQVYASGMGPTKSNRLNNDGAPVTATAYFNDTAPTSSVFTLGTSGNMNWSGNTFISYHFATLAGVSKVGSYTGNATNTTIDCGFSNGARFILIKRTDSTGDWFVYDSARGITSGISPYLLLNTTAAEVTNAGWLESASSGFLVNDNASTQLNINNATYIFLAIA